jgi:hypothetical protein
MEKDAIVIFPNGTTIGLESVIKYIQKRGLAAPHSIRDNLKSLDYFKKYLEEQRTRIEKFISLINNTKNQTNSASQKAYGIIVNLMIDEIYALYSSGNTIDELLQKYNELISVGGKANSLSYSQLIDIASFAILLKPKNEFKTSIISILDKNSQNDILLEGFINFIKGKGFVYTSKDFKFKGIYGYLSNIIAQSDKNKQLELLENYIENKWYDSNKESSWYDSHKSKEDIYVGYWCFEGLALSVALNLDSKKLIGVKNVPGDLIR